MIETVIGLRLKLHLNDFAIVNDNVRNPKIEHYSNQPHIMTLEELRDKAFFQNTIDIWIAYCDENNLKWHDAEQYVQFIRYLKLNGLKMQKFPLCIKESGGMIDRGKDKTNLLEKLSHFPEDDGSAYTVKLNNESLCIIRNYKHILGS
jgi:hypothetical protein